MKKKDLKKRIVAWILVAGMVLGVVGSVIAGVIAA